MKNVIFIAPPAAGKGTCSEYLIKNLGYEHLSTGDLLREEIASGSDLGKKIDSIISKGNLVDDEFMIKLVQGKLESLDSNQHFILEGFPRTIVQAEKLDNMFQDLNITNVVVIFLDVDFDLALKRTLGRINCPKCKRSYNLYFEEKKPMKDNICDDCNIELIKRNDDNEESFKVRFDSYMKDANLIIEHYKNLGILKSVKATDLDKMLKEVAEVVKND